MNIVTVDGRLGHDIDLRVDATGRIEGEISVAVNDYIGRDENTKEARYWTTWVTAVIRGERARALQDQLYKGRYVVVSGQLRTKNYKISDTKTLPMTFIQVSDIGLDTRTVPANAAQPE